MTIPAPTYLVTTVGLLPEQEVDWPAGWPPPRVGDIVDLNNDVTPPLYVCRVGWYPHGDGEDSTDPFIYVVLGPYPPGRPF